MAFADIYQHIYHQIYQQTYIKIQFSQNEPKKGKGNFLAKKVKSEKQKIARITYI